MSDEPKTAPAAEPKAVETDVKPAEVKADEAKPAQPAEAKTAVIVPDKFKSIVAEIEKMSVLDLSELVKVLEEKFGVSAAQPMMMGMMPGAAGAPAAAVEEKTEFDVELTATGDNKIGVIKVIREVTEKGLKEAKDMAEGAPVMVKTGIKKEAAEEIKQKLETAGAKVTLK